MYLLTRPFVWLTKIVKNLVMAPARVSRGRRNAQLRKDVKEMKKAA